MQANQLKGVGYVRSPKNKVLKGTRETLEFSRVPNRRTIHSRDLGTSVNWCRAIFAICNANRIHDLQDILPLRNKESIGALLNIHVDKVMKFTKILHGELMLQSHDGEPA